MTIPVTAPLFAGEPVPDWAAVPCSDTSPHPVHDHVSMTGPIDWDIYRCDGDPQRPPAR